MHFCARYKNPVLGLTWGVDPVNFGGLGTCIFLLYRGVCEFLVGVGTRCGAVLIFSILLFDCALVTFSVLNGVFVVFFLVYLIVLR